MLEDLQSLSSFLRQFWGLWLMILFVGVAVYAFRPRNKRHFDEASTVIFREDDDDKEHKDGGNS